MLDQARQAVRRIGLHCAVDERTAEDGHVRGRVAGYGTSEATGKGVAVDVTVNSLFGLFGSLCLVDVYSEDGTERRLLNDRIQAMLTGVALPDESHRAVRQPQRPRDTGVTDQEVAAYGRLELTDESVQFVVDVMNKSDGPIYAVRVRLIAYPSDAMKLASTGDATVSRMGAGSKHETLLELVPTGEWTMTDKIVAQVSYTDATEELHTLEVSPTPLVEVQDPRVPEPIDTAEFEKNLSRMNNGELSLSIGNLTVADMHERARAMLSSLKFHEVSANIRSAEGLLMGELNGWTRGRYLKKGVAVSVVTYGQEQGIGCSCRIVVYADDDKVILPVIEEARAALKV
jgi:hypothetical protein